MDYIKAVVMQTDSPEIQKIISKLNAYDDLILVAKINGELEVNLLTDCGDIVRLGCLSNEVLTQIEDNYSDDVDVDVVDFGVYKRDDGSVRLWVGLDVKELHGARKSKLPLIVGVGAVTGVLTIAVIAIKFITLYRRKSSEL
jgi:hypothetical protein